MGIALTKLSAGERREIAAGLFTVTTDDRSGEMHGLCPFHSESNPSFSYNFEKDVCHCLSCGAGGDLVDIYCQVNGLPKKEGFIAFCRAFGLENEKESAKRTDPRPKVVPLPAGDDLAAVWDLFPPLPAAWRKRLKTVRGWSDAAMDRLDIRMQTHYLCKKTGKLKPVARKEWRKIAIPIRDGHGKLKNIRLYKPGAKKFKIISWGRGFGSARLFPAAPLADMDPVVLCEGEADTICAISNGLNAITQTTKRMRWPKNHLTPFAGRDVVICYDADQPGMAYAKGAAASLVPVAGRVRRLVWPDLMGRLEDGTWPEKKGADLTDYFVKFGKSVDDFKALVATAVEGAPKSKGGAGAERLGSDEAEKLGGDEAGTLGSGAAGTEEKGLAAYFDIGINNRFSFKPRLLAEDILSDMDLCSDPLTGTLYRWTGAVWELFHVDYLHNIAVEKLGAEAKTSWVNDAVNLVVKMSTLPAGRAMNDRTDWACIKNGMFNVYTKELKPHDRDYFASFQLPVVFDPDKTPRADRWVKYLEESVQTPEVIDQLQEFAGLSLTRDTKYAKCMILIGPGSDGKSIYIKMLRKMVGPENCSAVSFNELERHFQRASLYGKVLNVSTEVGADALQSNYFKAIVTGDPIDASFKFQDSFTFTPFVKLIFATNIMPRVFDTSDGFYRRVLPVRFKKQFMGADDDKDLESKLDPELSGIFEWALIGLDRLRENRGFTESPETEDEMHQYRRLNNPVLCYVEEMLEIDPDASEQKEHLYKKYRDWCKESGVIAKGKINFFRELHNCVTTVENYRPRTPGGRTNLLRGVRYVGE